MPAQQGQIGRFSAFRFRNFRLYWMGHLVSLSGTWMQSAAQGWLVLHLTNSSFYLGLVGAAGSLPLLFLTLFGGVLADRFKKKTLLLFTQGLSILPAAALGLLTLTGTVQVAHVLVLVTLLGIVNALDIPVRQSFLIDLVEPPSLSHAIALNSAAFNGARMIGPAIAGYLIGWAGLPVCFFLNAVSFGASLLALTLIRLPDQRNNDDDSTGIFEQMKEGLAYIRIDREILSNMFLVAMISLFGLPYASLMPAYARDILHLGSDGYGLLMSSVGFGAFLGAVWLAYRVHGASLWFIKGFGLVFGLSMIVFSQSEAVPVAVIFLFLTGFSAVAVIASINAIIQSRVPGSLRGRVMSIYTTLFLGIFPIGSLMIGAASEWIGVKEAVTAGGGICLASVVIMHFLNRRNASANGGRA